METLSMKDIHRLIPSQKVSKAEFQYFLSCQAENGVEEVACDLRRPDALVTSLLSHAFNQSNIHTSQKK